ncbi:MAG: M20 family metallopeptidase [Proteobacteria bacterium]|nr:M20 family metallopeptidase [Pseudomonadota bacterium]MDA1057256.1 M20 family metallopeptidase [Pseudomonadota bacterium]
MADQWDAWQDDLTALRRDIHAHPETAFEEFRTADLVADQLTSYGIDVHRGLAKTGVVGVLKAGTGNRAIGLRADMDALPIEELNDFAHRSINQGKMHACGHDGHTTMLLGAARYLAQNRDFDGTVHFIFQPAEENEGGGGVMVEEGLFEQFPCESVYGMHNMPGLEVGHFAVRQGPIMAAFDRFTVHIQGKGAHAALPHTGIDPIVVGAHLVTAWQTLVSRTTDPIDSVVLSVTKFHGGDAYNVIPDRIELGGTVRTFRADTRDRMERQFREMGESICAAFGASFELRFDRCYPATVNTGEETGYAAAAATKVVGAANVNPNTPPLMGSEDFAFMLQARPGCYMLIGNGSGEDACMVHNPHYDFNDEILTLGARYWVQLAQDLLPIRA